MIQSSHYQMAVHQKSNPSSIEDEKLLEVLKNTLTQLELPLIIHILKKVSVPEKPLSVGEIKKYLDSMTGAEHSDKTLRRKIQSFCKLQNGSYREDDEEDVIPNILFLTFGGKIIEVTNQEKGNQSSRKRLQTKYYFSPLLDQSDVSMICGAIASNRYLSASEKQYLISRESLLALLENDIDILQIPITREDPSDPKNPQKKSTIIETEYQFHPTEIPEKPVVKKKYDPSNENLLHHVNQLHDAIENGYAIQVIYGIYDLDSETYRVQFHTRNPKAYRLNPYALLWNQGAYYLLATNRGHEDPIHLRVDRIMAIKPLPTQDDARIPQQRAQIPAILEPYFTYHENKPVFHAEKYTAVYPLMGIYSKPNKVTCTLECTATTLSILIDTFGPNLNIAPSPIAHNKDELDIHGKPQQFLAVQIANVQYDNLLQFCLQQHASITALKPKELVADVAAGLKASLERCTNYCSKL